MTTLIVLFFSFFIDAQSANAPSKTKELDSDNFLFPPLCGCKDCKQTNKFGPRTPPTFGASSNHKGCDIKAPKGTVVYASADGEVDEVTKDIPEKKGKGYGNQVVLKHKAPSGAVYYTRYGHLYEVRPGITKGATVKKGKDIGTVDSTGTSTGHHLHFEVIKCNGDGGEKDNCIAVNPQDYVTTDKPEEACEEIRKSNNVPASVEQ